MQVNLEQNEVTALVDALNWYIPQLREEIGKTESYDMRESLKAEEAALNSVLSKIGGTLKNTGMSDIGAKNPPWGDHRR
jgi:hypothetical protein